MKKLISFIFALFATTMAMAQNQGSFVVADKDGNSFLVRSLIFQRDESEQNYSWSTEGFENHYQKSLDISKLQFIARINEEIATASADEVTEMLEELSGTDEGDAEVIAASLQNNPNVEEAYTEDGDNIVVKMDDDDCYAAYPLYSLESLFSEDGEAEYVLDMIENNSKRRVGDSGISDKVAIFNFFEGGPYNTKLVFTELLTEMFKKNFYSVENYGHGYENGGTPTFTMAKLDDVISRSSEYAAIIIMSHGYKTKDGESYFATCEHYQTGMDYPSKQTVVVDNNRFVAHSSKMKLSPRCLLYLGPCYGIPDGGYPQNLGTSVIGWDGKNAISQIHADVFFHKLLFSNGWVEVKNALASSFQSDPFNPSTCLYKTENVNNWSYFFNSSLQKDYAEGMVLTLEDFSVSPQRRDNFKETYITPRDKFIKKTGTNTVFRINGYIKGYVGLPSYVSVRLEPIVRIQKSGEYDFTIPKKSLGTLLEFKGTAYDSYFEWVGLPFDNDMLEGIYRINVFAYTNSGWKLIEQPYPMYVVYSSKLDDNYALSEYTEEDMKVPQIFGSSGQPLEEIPLPAGTTKTFTIDGYSGHTFRTVSLEPEIADVSINGNTLTVKAGVEGETYIGVMDEQNRQMTAAKVKVTAGQTFNGQIVMERRYLVNNVNNYCYQESSFRMDNGIQLQIRYYNTEYWESTYDKSHHGIFIAVGPCTDVNQDWYEEGHDFFDEWYIAPVVTDEWVDEKIVISDNGDVQYFMNGENMGTHHFDMLTMDNAQNVTVDFWPYGWWTGHHHYMDDLKLTFPNKTISDDFNDGVIDTSIWQTPDNPDGVREEDGIMKLEQVQTDWPFHIRTNPIPL